MANNNSFEKNQRSCKQIGGLRWLLLLIVLNVWAGNAFSQKCSLFENSLVKKFDTFMYNRYHKKKIDSVFIKRPDYRFTVKTRFNYNLFISDLQHTDVQIHLESKHKSTISFSGSYLGLALSFSINPDKMSGKYFDTEFNLASYGNKFGFDVTIQTSEDINGSLTIDNELYKLREKSIRQTYLNLNGYYAFNNQRFSYPAAFSQSYIQRKSAGSFLISSSFQCYLFEVIADELPSDSLLRVFSGALSLGAGYGYNMVPEEHWLIHVSAIPTLAFLGKHYISLGKERENIHYKFPETIIVGRAAIVYNLNRFFAGSSLSYNYSHFGNKEDLVLQYNKWIARVFVGYRL